jgi:hypothetical protein
MTESFFSRLYDFSLSFFLQFDYDLPTASLPRCKSNDALFESYGCVDVVVDAMVCV